MLAFKKKQQLYYYTYANPKIGGVLKIGNPQIYSTKSECKQPVKTYWNLIHYRNIPFSQWQSEMQHPDTWQLVKALAFGGINGKPI